MQARHVQDRLPPTAPQSSNADLKMLNALADEDGKSRRNLTIADAESISSRFDVEFTSNAIVLIEKASDFSI